MYPDSREHSEQLHNCPKCGKHSLARVSEQRYQCVWCRFRRDLSQEGGFDGSESFLLFLFLGALIFVLVV